MNNKSRLFYAQKLLEKRLRGQKNKNNAKNISIIASYIETKQSTIEQTPKSYTKEQLYALGFNAIQIHKFFTFKNNYWTIKENLIINNEEIKTLKNLSKQLQIKDLKLAI